MCGRPADFSSAYFFLACSSLLRIWSYFLRNYTLTDIFIYIFSIQLCLVSFSLCFSFEINESQHHLTWPLTSKMSLGFFPPLSYSPSLKTIYLFSQSLCLIRMVFLGNFFLLFLFKYRFSLNISLKLFTEKLKHLFIAFFSLSLQFPVPSDGLYLFYLRIQFKKKLNTFPVIFFALSCKLCVNNQN